LRQWVENGVAPESLPIDVPRQPPSERRVICPYPQKVLFNENGEEGDRFYCSD
jgi:hypothetical protein